MDVIVGEQAQKEFDALPTTMKMRVLAVFARLENWPNVSGAKRLTGDWQGCARIRTGDWRVIFRPTRDQVVIERVAHRREVYE
jgi:mRNA-degrading endonuclease RelE of RelBE toxin-antitoxin system